MNLSGASEGFDYMPGAPNRALFYFIVNRGRRKYCIGASFLGGTDRGLVLLQFIMDTCFLN